MMKLFRPPFVLLAMSLPLLAQGVSKPDSPNELPDNFQSGLLYGEGHAYSLTAPKGWVMDELAWADQGIHAVFYPRGSSANGSQIAYTRFFGPHPKGAEGRANEDLKAFKDENPKVAIHAWPDIQTRLGMKAVIRSTSGDRYGNSEWQAYIEVPSGVIFIDMVAKNPADFASLRAPFQELVTSCSWISNRVVSPTHR